MLFVILLCAAHFFVGVDMDFHDDKTQSGRRGGGYMNQNFWREHQRTSNRMLSTFRVMIMSLLGDANTKVEKIAFIKKWAEKGPEGKAARMAQNIFAAQQQYNRMLHMLVFTTDNVNTIDYKRCLENFVSMKKMGMELDMMVQAILEYDNTDPSGRHYGRRNL